MITIFVMVFIFVQSALPGEMSGAESNFIVQLIAGLFNADGKSLAFWVRKIAHFTEYMILGGCLMLNAKDWFEYKRSSHELKLKASYAGVARARFNNLPRRLIIYAWIIGTIYAGTDEFHQRFVADRSGELRDVCIDAAGVAAGVLTSWIIIRKMNSSQKHKPLVD